MLADWLDAEREHKVIGKMGWPEVGYGNLRLRLCVNVISGDPVARLKEHKDRCPLAENGRGKCDHCYTSLFRYPHEALCLLRDRAREWLEENTDGWSGGLSSGGYAIETYDADTNKWTLHSTPTSDWDGCLIIAVLATEKK